MFSKAIVKKPCKNLINGITTSTLGKPDYEKVLVQHKKYIEALEQCGLEVTILEADENYPDSTFVEDTALLIPECAIISNPGAGSRKGESEFMVDTLKQFYDKVEFIKEPGTVEPGDIMKVGSHFYIGLSARTNKDGAMQVISLLEKYGMAGSVVKLEKVLHLKTGVSYLENNNLLATGEFVDKVEFKSFNIIKVDDDEAYAANSLWINDRVLVPAGFPKTKSAIENAGYETIAVDVSEFQKVDGGLSCLSLRF